METFQLHIPEPCSEKWQQMAQSGKSAFCSSCQQEVIDFTRMSDEEIRTYFRNAAGNTCGRFLKTQLGHTYHDRLSQKSGWRLRMPQLC